MQARIAHWGGIEALIKVLTSGSQPARMNVLGALRYIVKHPAAVFTSLTCMKRFGIPCRCTEPCLVCRYLAENSENRKRIAAAGGLPPLAKAFNAAWTSPSEVQELACKCLLNLSIDHGESHDD